MPRLSPKPKSAVEASDVHPGLPHARVHPSLHAPRRRPTPADDAAFAKAFSALGESTRLRIMQMLPREPICHQMYNVMELADELGLKQPTVSHHLKILAEAGLVQSRRHCNNVYFYVDQPAVIHWLKEVKSRFGCEEPRE